MKTAEEKADKYIYNEYIDYGDLNEKAEKQIRKAFIAGYLTAKAENEQTANAKAKALLEEAQFQIEHKLLDLPTPQYLKAMREVSKVIKSLSLIPKDTTKD